MRAWRRVLLPLTLILLAAIMRPIALTADAEVAMPLSAFSGEKSVTLFLNTREKGDLTGESDILKYQFTPTESGEYMFQSFSGSPDFSFNVSAFLYRGDEEDPVAQDASGGGAQLSLRMDAGVSYTLILRGQSSSDQGTIAVEVMRQAKGRSLAMPIRLQPESTRYAKVITKPRDAHFYTFTAPNDGLYTIRTETAGDEPLDTQGYLLDKNGVALSYNDDILPQIDGNFCIRMRLQAGETYFIRVNAFSNLTGIYRLVLLVPDGREQEAASVQLSEATLTLNVGVSKTLTATLSPQDAYPDVFWTSSDWSVARVSPDGEITAVAEGKATISAITANGLAARCQISVSPVPIEKIEFTESEITLMQGAQRQLKPVIEPSLASSQPLTYSSSDASVVQVDEQGMLTGISEGSAKITVESTGGGKSAVLTVQVTPPAARYRALVMGEQIYTDGRTRVGAVNTAEGFANMLDAQSIGGSPYQVRLQLDSTYQEFMDGIELAFSGASENDISLFYINCHGDYVDGVAYIELHDGTKVTAQRLADLLSKVRGTVVIMIDCCRSGGFISQPDAAGNFASGVNHAFSKKNTGSPLTSGRFKILTSTSDHEDSYRISSDGSVTEASMATVFARSVCDGAGWDLIKSKRRSMKADTNKDGKVTLTEIYQYAKKRVPYYLSGTGVSQSVQVYPEGDSLVLFQK